VEILEKKFKALGHGVRLTIYRALREQKLCVCEITELLGRSQPSISQHLSTLSHAGLIDSERHGQWTFYTAREDRFREAIDFLLEDQPDELAERIDSIKQLNLCEMRDSQGNLQIEEAPS
jgi:ArsR family transcriptional regulator